MPVTPSANPWRLTPHCNRVRCEPDWHLGPAWASRLRDYDLWFVWSGRGRMLTSIGEIELAPGLCVWMQPGRQYQASHDPSAPLGVNFFHFESRETAAPAPPPFEVMRTAHPEFADTMMRRILSLRADARETAHASAEALFGALLGELAREACSHPEGPADTGIEQHHRLIVQRITAEIRENPGRQHAVAGLARAAGYSVDHFSRLFEKFNGRRPQDFVIEARMSRARQLLAETGLSIGQIADTLGFQDIYFFSRQFRQRVGVTPSRYRTALASSFESTT